MGNHHLSYSDDGWVKVWVRGAEKGRLWQFFWQPGFEFLQVLVRSFLWDELICQGLNRKPQSEIQQAKLFCHCLTLPKQSRLQMDCVGCYAAIQIF